MDILRKFGCIISFMLVSVIMVNWCSYMQILNNRRHVLTKDTAGTVKLWEITRGTVIHNYGEVSIPAWFTVDTRLGSLAVHLDTPRCSSAEMYSANLYIPGKPEDSKVINYVIEMMVLEKPLDSINSDGVAGMPGGQVTHPAVGGDGIFRTGSLGKSLNHP